MEEATHEVEVCDMIDWDPEANSGEVIVMPTDTHLLHSAECSAFKCWSQQDD